MTLLQLSNTFDSLAATVPGLMSYWFGWPSDRVRMRATNDTDELTGANFPRLLFAVPTMEQDLRTKKDVYNVQLFFDDLLGYDNDGEADDQTQVEKWRNLMNTATAFLKTMEAALPLLRPDGLMVVGNPRFTLDSFAGQARLITVVVDMQLATNSSCGAVLPFPDGFPDGFPWPPADAEYGPWVKREKQFDNQAYAALDWTDNDLALSDVWQFDVFMNGQRLLPEQYSITGNVVTIDANTHVEGSYYFIRGIWSL